MSMKPVVHSFCYALDFLREQVADVGATDMATQPPGIKNHPAWIVGHLAFACELLGGVIGIPAWLPADWAPRFGSGSRPVADVTAYETKETLLAILNDAQSRVVNAVKQLTDAQLDQPFPDPAYRDVFPTVRHALTQVLVGHTALHVGQLSVWRHAMGFPALGRSFE